MATKRKRKRAPSGFDRSTWQTPPQIVGAVRALADRFGWLLFDPATAPSNPTRADVFISPEPPESDAPGICRASNGLDVHRWPTAWSRYPGDRAGVLAYLNPPWRGSALPIMPWARAARRWVNDSLGRGRHALAFVAPANLSAPWFHHLIARSDEDEEPWGCPRPLVRAHVLAFKNRVAFVHPDTGCVGERPNVTTALVALGEPWTPAVRAAFVGELRERGVVARWL